MKTGLSDLSWRPLHNIIITLIWILTDGACHHLPRLVLGDQWGSGLEKFENDGSGIAVVLITF